MPTRQQKMAKRGFTQLGRGFYVKVATRGRWCVGVGVLFPPSGGVLRFERAYPIAEAAVKAIAYEVPALVAVAGELGDLEVGARRSRRKRGRNRRVLKKLGVKFRKRVNKVAKNIAKAKVVKSLNKVKAKALASPIASAGIRAAASALNAFGVPAPVTRMALNQARYAAIDRAEHGGRAAQVARFSEGALSDKEHRRKIAREIKRRQVDALKKAARDMIPGLKQAAAAKARAAGGVSAAQLGSVLQTGYDPTGGCVVLPPRTRIGAYHRGWFAS